MKIFSPNEPNMALTASQEGINRGHAGEKLFLTIFIVPVHGAPTCDVTMRCPDPAPPVALQHSKWHHVIGTAEHTFRDAGRQPVLIYCGMVK